MTLLSYDFMVRALLAAVFTGLAAPAVGTYLVQRRLALMGDGIGHVAVTGVALGLLTGTSPTITAVLVATVGAVIIEVIRQQGRTGGDVALALLFYGGIAGGVDNLERVAQLIRETSADVVLLQEVDKGTRRSGGVDQPAVLSRLTGLHVAFGRRLAVDLHISPDEGEILALLGRELRRHGIDKRLNS